MATISAAAFGVKCGLVRAARVRFCGPFFESDGDEPALIFPILAASHICAGAGCAGHDLVGQPVELVDAAAWAPDQWERVALYRGMADCLGEWCLCHDWKPLSVWATPASWAAHDCDGIVIVDWHRMPAKLLGHLQVICETLALATRLDQAIRAAHARTFPAIPEILIAT